MTSACATTKEHPIVVDGFCLNYQPVETRVEPAEGAEDATAGNQYDTDETTFKVWENNGVYDRLCG